MDALAETSAVRRVIFGPFDTEGYREVAVRPDEIHESGGRAYIWWEARAFEVVSKVISPTGNGVLDMLDRAHSNVGHRYYPPLTPEQYHARLTDALEQCPAMGDLPPALLRDLFCEPQRHIEDMVNHRDKGISTAWCRHASLLVRFIDIHLLTAQDFYPSGMPCPIERGLVVRPVRSEVSKAFKVTWRECASGRADYFDLEGERGGERVLLGRFGTERAAECALARMETICALHRIDDSPKPLR